MARCKTTQRQRIVFVYVVICILTIGLTGRLGYLMVARADYYGKKAKDVQQRERSIKAKRGTIYDRNGEVLAGNKPVSTISVIHNQITEPEKVIKQLADLLDLEEETVRKRVEKVSSIERIKANVPKETSDKIRDLKLDGVMVDEDYQRYYPYDTLASRVIGFTGSDNQGIIGLEVWYDEILQGKKGAILTMTNARGIEIDGKAEERREPVAGKNIYTSLDVNLQKFATQAADKVRKAKQALGVRIIMMNPQNGEIYALAIKPDFNLNEPFTIQSDETSASWEMMTESEKQNALNQMWRNFTINDTYEPGSTFKVFTSAMGLEEGVVDENSQFNCSGSKTVAGRTIKCWRSPRSHGQETFVQGVQNSCNPVFMEVAERIGASKFYDYMIKFGFKSKTNIDLPGEAVGILHSKNNIGPVELATMSFGQSFQITPMQLLSAAAAAVNGGY
ncbi:MAG: peptidoglycan glycosyltransferase, partial [Lachnospiraceae bacterium]|nr:peptidoglycan glycosyltransferase [Lachnospiraceae bacterium]